MGGTMSRRRFVGATVAGLAGSELLRAAPAFSKSTSTPKPIPGGFLIPSFATVPANPDVHVLPPAVGFEMSTITDFNGTVAAADMQGTASGSDGSSWFFDADMRFMDGEYVGEDGRHHNGTFGFVWIDLFTGAVSDPDTEQVHDFEPGIASSGLFWTIPIDGGAVDASPGTGRARYRLHELALNDYHDFFTAISPNPPVVPSHVSFEVTWSGGNDRRRIADTDYDFTGTFIVSDARIAFTAWNDGTGVVYTSNPDAQTSNDAGVGHERNGVFF